MYLAAQEANPFGSLLALYLVAEDSFSGVRVKLAGEIKLNEETGQITSTFINTPQVPFEDFELSFFGGPRAATATPALCGGYETSATFTPWSGEAPLTQLSQPGEFSVTSGAGGGACPVTQPFAPSFRAGSTSAQAGAFAPFTLQITRPDGDQALSGISVRLPAGAAAILASVNPCQEPAAAVGQCGPESEIGQATASAGLGPDPYNETGRVYITGPYDGAPFGLAIVTPAVAGPFNLGDVVVRSTMNVDPHTAAVTIGSTVPTIIQGVGRQKSGIPLQLQHITVTVDRPNFEFNPTDCNPMKIEGTLAGAQGATEAVSSLFQIQNCASLGFTPSVTAATQGRTSKLDGASLKLKFASARGQANVAKTVLTIPAVLPARLSTIQKACLARVFEANPAACPEGSDIGSAVVHTPVLKSPLTGPIYLVSHGNAAWPDAELVLQGEGVTVILDGQTAIKKGVTTSSFLTVPDAPFESVEATLPEGPHSALTTNLPASAKYSLCGQSLTIPTALTGQNGTAIGQSVKVKVEGCQAAKASKTRKLTRAQKLTLALKACRRDHPHSHSERLGCELRARKRHAPSTRASKGRAQDLNAHRRSRFST